MTTSADNIPEVPKPNEVPTAKKDVQAEKALTDEIDRNSKSAEGIKEAFDKLQGESPNVSLSEEKQELDELKAELDTINGRTSEQTPSEKKEPALDAQVIRQKLETGIDLTELPANKILEYQIDKNYQDILKKAPQARRQDIAYSLALRFETISLYQRISEQAIFGPKDFERFDTPDAIAPLMPQIKAGLVQAQQDIAQNRPQVRFSVDNGWLYLHQGQKGETAYRIYLSPEPTAIGRVFSDLAKAIPENVGYQMKTFDRPDRAQDVARMDKVIIYCSEDNFDAILRAVGKIYGLHAADFKGRLSPGGGTIAPLEGMSIAKQPAQTPGQQEVTGTQDAANRIKEKVNQKLPAITREGIRQYKTVQEAYQSDEGKFLWAAMSGGKDNVVRNLYFPNNSVPSDHLENLAQAYLETVYNAALRNYVEGKQVTVAEIKDTFLRLVKTRQIPLTDAQFKYLQNQSPYIYQNRNITDKIVGSARSAGLMIALDKKLKAGQPPSEALREILAA